MLSMMSASTVDAAVERTCVGNTHGPHRPVSAIGRGRRGRWWRAAAWTAAAGAALIGSLALVGGECRMNAVTPRPRHSYDYESTVARSLVPVVPTSYICKGTLTPELDATMVQ